MQKTTPTNLNNRLPFLTFNLDTQFYGLLVEDVIEVAAMVERMPVPDSPPEVLGIINRHGTPLLLIDLRMIFNQKAQPITSATLFVVTGRGQEQLGLVVDEVHQVEYVDKPQFQELSTSGKYIRGIISYRSQLIPVVSLAALLESFMSRLPDRQDSKQG